MYGPELAPGPPTGIDENGFPYSLGQREVGSRIGVKDGLAKIHAFGLQVGQLSRSNIVVCERRCAVMEAEFGGLQFDVAETDGIEEGAGEHAFRGRDDDGAGARCPPGAFQNGLF